MTSPVTILLLDDEPLLRRATVLLLSRRGARVTAAASADEAVALARRRVYDVAVLDVSPPGPSAAEVVRRIAAEALPPRRVIAVSATPLSGPEAEGLTLVLPRPYPFESLVRAVHGEGRRKRTRSGVFRTVEQGTVDRRRRSAGAASEDRGAQGQEALTVNPRRGAAGAGRDCAG
jgi:CheY-like chemotaxis protein